MRLGGKTGESQSVSIGAPAANAGKFTVSQLDEDSKR